MTNKQKFEHKFTRDDRLVPGCRQGRCGDAVTKSVFIPGATPALLIATNATFAYLQLLRGALLFTTYSIHFATLSFTYMGPSYIINWHAYGLQQAQAKEVEAERLHKRRREEDEGRTKGHRADGDSADGEGENTEG